MKDGLTQRRGGAESEPRHASAGFPRRGRGATPQTIDTVDTKAKNLFGRQILKVRYRRLSTWSNEHVAIAESILVRYFMKLGAFQTINDAAMRIVINRLQQGMLEDHAIWAINAKLASLGETHAEKLKTLNSIPGVVPSPQRFFEGDIFEAWLDRSQEMRAQIAEANRAAAQRKAVDPAERQRREQRAAAELAHGQAEDARREQAARERREHEQRVAFFKSMPPEAQDALKDEARAQLRRDGKLTGKVAWDAQLVLAAARNLIKLEGGAS